MTEWLDRLRFLWEEEVAPSEGGPRVGREAASGVPRPVRNATRFALIGAVSISVMAQIVGVRLVAPVDAAPSYTAQCVRHCNTAFRNCLDGCPKGNAGNFCRSACQKQHSHCTSGCRS